MAECPIDEDAAKSWVYPCHIPVRNYQKDIALSCLMENTLVSLPTGLGKTLIAAVVMYNFRRWFPQGKIIFLAPTRPLVSQQYESCRDVMHLCNSELGMLDGSISSSARARMWHEKNIFFCTPHVVENDLFSETCPFSQIVCIVIDEAHRASSSSYAYAKVIRLMNDRPVRIVGLTATPGSDRKAIQSVLRHLKISRVEYRSENSPDIACFVQDKDVDVIKCRPIDRSQKSNLTSSMLEQYMDDLIHMMACELKENGFLVSSKPEHISLFVLNEAERQVKGGHISNYREVMDAVTIAKFLVQGKQLLRQGPSKVLSHFNTLDAMASNSYSYFRTHTSYVGLVKLLRTMCNVDQSKESTLVADSGVAGKLSMLKDLLLEHFHPDSNSNNITSNSKAIVFVNRRATVAQVVLELSNCAGLRVRQFIGQGHSKGLGSGAKGQTQAEQQAIVQAFNRGLVNVLVATSIAEEGLDISEVDLVVSFDFTTSPVRMLQRMGRTGRKRSGRAVILMLEGKEEDRVCKSSDFVELAQDLTATFRHMTFYQRSPRMLPENVFPELVMKDLRSQNDSTVSNRNLPSSGTVPVCDEEIEMDAFECEKNFCRKANDFVSQRDITPKSLGDMFPENVFPELVMKDLRSQNDSTVSNRNLPSSGTVPVCDEEIEMDAFECEKNFCRKANDFVSQRDITSKSLGDMYAEGHTDEKTITSRNSCCTSPQVLGSSPSSIQISEWRNELREHNSGIPVRKSGEKVTSEGLSNRSVDHNIATSDISSSYFPNQSLKSGATVEWTDTQLPSWQSMFSAQFLSSISPETDGLAGSQSPAVPEASREDSSPPIETTHKSRQSFVICDSVFTSDSDTDTDEEEQAISINVNHGVDRVGETGDISPRPFLVADDIYSTSDDETDSVNHDDYTACQPKAEAKIRATGESPFARSPIVVGCKGSSGDDDSGCIEGSENLNSRANDFPLLKAHHRGVIKQNSMNVKKESNNVCFSANANEKSEVHDIFSRIDEMDDNDDDDFEMLKMFQIANSPKSSGLSNVAATPIAPGSTQSSRSYADNSSPCAICSDSGTHDGEDTGVFCDGPCGSFLHLACCGLQNVPPSTQFYCDSCAARRSGVTEVIACQLCKNTSGTMRRSLSGDWVHSMCVLFTPELVFDDHNRLSSLSMLDKNRQSLQCSICKGFGGGNVQCAHGDCLVSFHPYCAFISNRQMVTRVDSKSCHCFEIYCNDHKYRLSEGTILSTTIPCPSSEGAERSADWSASSDRLVDSATKVATQNEWKRLRQQKSIKVSKRSRKDPHRKGYKRNPFIDFEADVSGSDSGDERDSLVEGELSGSFINDGDYTQAGVDNDGIAFYRRVHQDLNLSPSPSSVANLPFARRGRKLPITEKILRGAACNRSSDQQEDSYYDEDSFVVLDASTTDTSERPSRQVRNDSSFDLFSD